MKTSNDLNVLLNQKPKKEWIKEHPLAKGVKYLTIARVEYLLTAIFVNWSVEVKTIQMIANSVVVSVRLHFKDPVSGEMLWTDGIGAAPIQTDKGASATDFSQVKNDAVMKAAPAAESFAIKDAAHKLGNLFGADLNRNDEIAYSGLLGNFDELAKFRTRLSKRMAESQDPDVESAMMEETLETIEDYKRVLKKYFNDEFTG